MNDFKIGQEWVSRTTNAPDDDSPSVIGPAGEPPCPAPLEETPFSALMSRGQPTAADVEMRLRQNARYLREHHPHFQAMADTQEEAADLIRSKAGDAPSLVPQEPASDMLRMGAATLAQEVLASKQNVGNYLRGLAQQVLDAANKAQPPAVSASPSALEQAKQHPLWVLCNRIDAALRAIRQSTDLDRAIEIAATTGWLTAEIRGHVPTLKAQAEQLATVEDKLGTQEGLSALLRNRAEKAEEQLAAKDKDLRIQASNAVYRENELRKSLLQRLNDAGEQLAALQREKEQSESLRVMHARRQGAADGFQEGWHAALTRIRQGDSLADLDLVPDSASHYRERAEQAERERAALAQQVEKLAKYRGGEWAGHAKDCAAALCADCEPPCDCTCGFENRLDAALRAHDALKQMTNEWLDAAERMRLRRGQQTREKRGHEVLADAAYALRAALTAAEERQG